MIFFHEIVFIGKIQDDILFEIRYCWVYDEIICMQLAGVAGE